MIQAGAVTSSRGHELREEWRAIKRAWLVQVARTPRLLTAGVYDTLTVEERNYLRTVRSGG